MSPPRNPRSLAAAALGAAALAAGAGAFALSGGDASAAKPVRTALVELDEFSLRSSAPVLKAGRVTFAVRNTGRIEHELVVIRTARRGDRIPVGLHGPASSKAGEVVLGSDHSRVRHSDARARREHIAPGGSRRMTATLKPGRYVLLCGIGSHYLAGQYAELTVR